MVLALTRSASTASLASSSLKFKKPKGDDVVQMRFDANTAFVQQVFMHLTDNPGDLGTLQMQLKRLQVAAQEQTASAACIGQNFTTFGLLNQLDKDVIMDWVVRSSDFDKQDMHDIEKFDDEAPYHLCSLGTQLPISFRMPSCLQNIQVCLRFFDKRHGDTGSKLAKLKANSRYVYQSGRVDFKDTVYSHKFDKDNLLEDGN